MSFSSSSRRSSSWSLSKQRAARRHPSPITVEVCEISDEDDELLFAKPSSRRRLVNKEMKAASYAVSDVKEIDLKRTSVKKRKPDRPPDQSCSYSDQLAAAFQVQPCPVESSKHLKKKCMQKGRYAATSEKKIKKKKKKRRCIITFDDSDDNDSFIGKPMLTLTKQKNVTHRQQPTPKPFTARTKSLVQKEAKERLAKETGPSDTLQGKAQHEADQTQALKQRLGSTSLSSPALTNGDPATAMKKKSSPNVQGKIDDLQMLQEMFANTSLESQQHDPFPPDSQFEDAVEELLEAKDDDGSFRGITDGITLGKPSIAVAKAPSRWEKWLVEPLASSRHQEQDDELQENLPARKEKGANDQVDQAHSKVFASADPQPRSATKLPLLRFFSRLPLAPGKTPCSLPTTPATHQRRMTERDAYSSADRVDERIAQSEPLKIPGSASRDEPAIESVLVELVDNDTADTGAAANTSAGTVVPAVSTLEGGMIELVNKSKPDTACEGLMRPDVPAHRASKLERAMVKLGDDTKTDKDAAEEQSIQDDANTTPLKITNSGILQTSDNTFDLLQDDDGSTNDNATLVAKSSASTEIGAGNIGAQIITKGGEKVETLDSSGAESDDELEECSSEESSDEEVDALGSNESSQGKVAKSGDKWLLERVSQSTLKSTHSERSREVSQSPGSRDVDFTTETSSVNGVRTSKRSNSFNDRAPSMTSAAVSRPSVVDLQAADPVSPSTPTGREVVRTRVTRKVSLSPTVMGDLPVVEEASRTENAVITESSEVASSTILESSDFSESNDVIEFTYREDSPVGICERICKNNEMRAIVSGFEREAQNNSNKEPFPLEAFQHLWSVVEQEELLLDAESIEDSGAFRAANRSVSTGDSADQGAAQYGRILPRALDRLFRDIMGVEKKNIFVDLGHGIGNACLQSAYTIGCQSRGVELVDARFYASEAFRRCLAKVMLEDNKKNSQWKYAPGLVQLKHGRLEDPTFHEWLTTADRVFVNNYNDVFGSKSKCRNEGDTIDAKIAALFACMKPGSVLATMHEIDALAKRSQQEVVEFRQKHNLDSFCPENASFFEMEKHKLGPANETTSWSKGGGNSKMILVYKYTRVSQLGSEDGRGVFLCANPNCAHARNADPIPAATNGDRGLRLSHCGCNISPIATRGRKKTKPNSRYGDDYLC